LTEAATPAAIRIFLERSDKSTKSLDYDSVTKPLIKAILTVRIRRP
jgi:hypothetical protein